MLKFLINIYITQPREKDKKRFSTFYFLVFLFTALTLAQINYILYPTPELSELSHISGKLIKVSYSSGRHQRTVTATILSANHKEKSIVVSTTKEDAEYYRNNMERPIQVWYRWNMFHYSASQVILNGQVIRPYSKKIASKVYYISLTTLYIALPLLLHALLKPWLVLGVRQLKNRK